MSALCATDAEKVLAANGGGGQGGTCHDPGLMRNPSRRLHRQQGKWGWVGQVLGGLAATGGGRLNSGAMVWWAGGGNP